MRNVVTYSKGHREIAKKEKLFLFCLQIDGTPIKKFGCITEWGPIPEDQARELLDAWIEIKKKYSKTSKKNRARTT